MADSQIEFRLDVADRRSELLEIEESVIEQMRRHGIAERGEHRAANMRSLFFQIRDQTIDSRALQV